MGCSRSCTIAQSLFRMIQPGDYILTMVSFSRESLQPDVTLLQNGKYIHSNPVGDSATTLRFDTTVRYCTGWRDLENGNWHVCDSNAMVDAKYEQCKPCMDKTGFNPAFYFADTVSKQQEKRNAQSHVLYLAYITPGVVKVGIAHEPRKIVRLLEQGARDALILDTFPSANVARSYEEKIAKLDGIIEHVQVMKKVAHLRESYRHEQATETLDTTLAHIEQSLGVSFDPQPLALDQYFSEHPLPDLSDAIDMTGQNTISGTIIGMVGSILISKYHDEHLLLPLKRFIGYPLHVSTGESELTLPSRQVSLF